MKFRKKTTVTISAILAFWLLLSLIAEKKNTEKNLVIIGQNLNNQKAVIVYDPDPFYNLDAQISKSFAQGLAKNGWTSKVVNVTTAENLSDEQFDLYVFCANTYNWAPDWALSNLIKNHQGLKGKNVVAITLGSGATKRSKRVLEALINQKEATLVDSKVFWLLRPNDESRLKESNVQVAVEMAAIFGNQIARHFEYKKNN